MTTVSVSCRCGSVAVKVNTTSGTHTRCHCILCHKVMLHYGQNPDREAGVDLYQTSPDRLSFDRGQDLLQAARVSPRDMIRWIASCCDTPMFTTAGRAIYAHVGVALCNLDNPDDLEKLGPVRARSYIPKANGRWRHENPAALMAGFTRRAIASLLTGGRRKNPFFDPRTGRPVADPVMLPRISE